jgi:hypothetical protein
MSKFWDKVKTAAKACWRYFWDNLIAFDQWVNVFLGPVFNLALFLEAKHCGTDTARLAWHGAPDETISSVLGKNKGVSRISAWVAYWLDKIDRNHTDKSIEADEGR